MIQNEETANRDKDLFAPIRVQYIVAQEFRALAITVREIFAGKRLGSTATVVVIVRNDTKCSWEVTTAHVGDTRAILVPLKSVVHNRTKGALSPFILTEDHRLDNFKEFQRVWEDHQQNEIYKKSGKRETVVACRKCCITGEVGPQVVLNETTGVSLMVTRSFGDCLASPAIIYEPEISFRELPDECKIIVASDGVWDVCNLEQVARLARSSSKASRIARKVCATAKEKRLYSGQRPDDISCLVVDLETKSSTAMRREVLVSG